MHMEGYGIKVIAHGIAYCTITNEKTSPCMQTVLVFRGNNVNRIIIRMSWTQKKLLTRWAHKKPRRNTLEKQTSHKVNLLNDEEINRIYQNVGYSVNGNPSEAVNTERSNITTAKER